MSHTPATPTTLTQQIYFFQNASEWVAVGMSNSEFD